MTDISIKPMLAEPVDFRHVRYPVAVSPKLDGIRCLITGGVAYSRSGKPLPNRYLQSLVSRTPHLLEWLDGELVVGGETDEGLFRATTSGIMSRDGEPDIKFHVFDCLTQPSNSFRRRFSDLTERQLPLWAQILPQVVCGDEETVLRLENKFVSDGYEGAMIRWLDGPYKFGRSTAKQAWLTKLKRFTDTEAVVLGSEEMLHNDNEPFKNAQGRTQRQSLQENMRGAGVLGALLCQLPDGIVFSIGTGFSMGQREQLWRERDTLPGRLVTFKSVGYGVKEAPRFPVFKGFRDAADL